MPNIRVSKVKTRRGTNDQRKHVVFDQGELVSTTDTKRLFIGTGTLSGGFVVGSKNHTPLTNYFSLSNTIAEVGDIVNANNATYQLTAVDYTNINSWVNIGTKVDPILFSYNSNNTLTINPASISANYIDPDTVLHGLKIENGVLQLNYNTKNFTLSSDTLTLKVDGVDEREISSTSLLSGGGLLGGSGNKLRIDIDTDYFVFDGNKLSLSATPPVTLQFTDLDENWFGSGLFYDFGTQQITANVTGVDNKTLTTNVSGQAAIKSSLIGSGLRMDSTAGILSSVLTDVDNVTLVKTDSGVISLSSNPSLSGSSKWSQISVDQYGRVIDKGTSVYDVLIGDSTLSNANRTNSLSSIFNGTPDFTINGSFNSAPITTFTALSSDGTTTIFLSSAGFIVFEGNMTTKVGGVVNQLGRFAIPIFTF